MRAIKKGKGETLVAGMSRCNKVKVFRWRNLRAVRCTFACRLIVPREFLSPPPPPGTALWIILHGRPRRYLWPNAAALLLPRIDTQGNGNNRAPFLNNAKISVVWSLPLPLPASCRRSIFSETPVIPIILGSTSRHSKRVSRARIFYFSTDTRESLP